MGQQVSYDLLNINIMLLIILLRANHLEPGRLLWSLSDLTPPRIVTGGHGLVSEVWLATEHHGICTVVPPSRLSLTFVFLA